MSGSAAPRRPWAVGIEADLELVAQARRNADDSSDDSVMFRVPLYIKILKPEAYEHRVLSFGLYNRDFENMTRMDEMRQQVVGEFLAQMRAMPTSSIHSWEDLCACVAGPLEEAQQLRQLYDDGPSENLITSTTVRSVLTFDAVFLAVLLVYYSEDIERVRLPNFRRLCSLLWQIGFKHYVDVMYFDLWLLENQIPLFLVRRLWNQLYMDNSDQRFNTHIRCSIVPALQTYLHPRAELLTLDDDHSISFEDCDHLLHCLYIAFCDEDAPASELQSPDAAKLTSASGQTSPESVHMSESAVIDQPSRLSAARWTVLETLGTLLQCLRRWVGRIILLFRRKTQNPTNDHMYRSLLPVTELHKSGIIVRGEPRSLSNIRLVKSTFFKATLYLPQIWISDGTDTILRNLSSFEMFHSDEEHKLISYLSIMDDLINTEEDVRLLRKGKDPVIGFNFLGDDKSIAALFNGWGENLIFSPSEEYLKLRKDVNGWCMHEKRVMFIRFVDRFLDRPWILFSLAAATLLLVMTALQTIYTIMGFNKPS